MHFHSTCQKPPSALHCLPPSFHHTIPCSGNHVTSYSGTITVNAAGLGGRTYLSGDTSSSLTWPTSILPPTYTLFHIAKYSDTVNQERILHGLTVDWLSGFHQGHVGVAYHNGWLTSQTGFSGTDWLLSTDQNGLYRANGVQRSTGVAPGSPSYGQIAVNSGTVSSEVSSWALAAVVVFNRTLSEAEIDAVEEWMRQAYSLPYAPPSPPSPLPPSPAPPYPSPPNPFPLFWNEAHMP